MTAKHEHVIRYAKPKNIMANEKEEGNDWITKEQQTNVVVVQSSDDKSDGWDRLEHGGDESLD